MRISVVGMGYVGVVVAACLADSGHLVVGVDSDHARLEALREGRLPFYEPGVHDLITRGIGTARLAFTSDLAGAIRKAEVIFITVGTPATADGALDISQVEAVARRVADQADRPKILVIKSTVPVGTGDAIQQALGDTCPFRVAVVSNPEFLREGAALQDFLNPDRVVLGGDDPAAIRVLKELYAPFVGNDRPVLVMDRRSAELAKCAANLMLAARISLMNEIAALCEYLGADVEPVRQVVGADRRIGSAFLYPGLGYGGSCFPKDVESLVTLGRQNGLRLQLAEGVQEVNRRQRLAFLAKVERHFASSLSGRPLTVWGLAFKPETDDIREAPALTIIEGLLQRGASVTAYDPRATARAAEILGNRVRYAADLYDSVQGAQALVLATEWECFRNPDWARLKAAMTSPVIFDGRNLYDPVLLRRLGFTYYGVGRP